MQGRPLVPSSPLCIVSGRRGEWSQCEEGAAALPVTGPAHVLKRPTCVSKREETIPNVVFVLPSAALGSLRWSLMDGGSWDCCCPVVQRAATFPPTPLAPTTSARNPNVTLGGGGWTQGGQEDPGRGLPVGARHVSAWLLADCSFRCVCWLGSSSQAEQACRSLGVWKSQRGSGKVVTPEDLQLNPQRGL